MPDLRCTTANEKVPFDLVRWAAMVTYFFLPGLRRLSRIRPAVRGFGMSMMPLMRYGWPRCTSFVVSSMLGPMPRTIGIASAADRPAMTGSVGRATSATMVNECAGTNVREKLPSASVTTSASGCTGSPARVMVPRWTIVPAGGTTPLSSTTAPRSRTAFANGAV